MCWHYYTGVYYWQHQLFSRLTLPLAYLRRNNMLLEVTPSDTINNCYKDMSTMAYKKAQDDNENDQYGIQSVTIDDGDLAIGEWKSDDEGEASTETQPTQGFTAEFAKPCATPYQPGLVLYKVGRKVHGF